MNSEIPEKHRCQPEAKNAFWHGPGNGIYSMTGWSVNLNIFNDQSILFDLYSIVNHT